METLSKISVLVVDCQSTGASPSHGSLLEVGWAQTQAEVEPQRQEGATSHVVALPSGHTLPPKIAQLTGIGDAELAQAIEPIEVWRRFRLATCGVAAAVIHFARFERAFLRALHQQYAAAEAFPIQIICSHDIAVRLLPDLPRRGLRALAGYYGFGLDMERRSASHVVATAFVWHHLVVALAGQGVTTLAELRLWLTHTRPPKVSRKTYPMPRQLRLDVPDAPGVYRMCRGNGDLLYIGKATSLHRRVNSYFQKQSKVAEHTLEMLTQARHVDFTVTESAVEAALLETDEIKRQAPPYNIALVQGRWALAFLDRRLRVAEISERYCVGPLRHADDVLALAALCDFATGHCEASALETLFDGRAEPPNAECVSAGAVLFRQQNLYGLEVPTRNQARRQLLRLGARLWRERLVSRAAAGVEAETVDAEAETDEDRAWDPERVAAALCSVVRRAGGALRRARWFTSMTEASVAWTHQCGRWRVLELSVGQVVKRSWCADDSYQCPTPPHYSRRWATRQRCFSPATYDRLRVLTTELRRLTSTSDQVQVCFGPNQRWSGERLRRALQWL